MVLYSFYFTSKGCKLSGVPMRFDCACDAAAVAKAKEIASTALNKRDGVEILQHERLVGSVPTALATWSLRRRVWSA